MENKKFCKFCGEEVDKDSIVCSKCGRQLTVIKEKQKKDETTIKEPITNIEESKFYTQTWFMWVMLVFFAPVGIFFMWKFHPEMKKRTKVILTVIFSLIFLIFFAISDYNNSADQNELYNNDSSSSNNSAIEKKKKVEVIDFSTMKEHEILAWCNENNLSCKFQREYSNTIAKDKFIKQSTDAKEQVEEDSEIIITYSLGKAPSKEELNALKKAESYSELMHMSKKAIYDQLTSKYGEAFDKKAAQYAIDNIKADWKANALAKAKEYRDLMNMSKNAIYEQLISEYGEKFTKEEAKYAINHLDD